MAEPSGTVEAVELLPCPFCGGTAAIEPKNWHGRDWIGVFCTDCGLFQDSRKPVEAEAIAAWNTRPTPSDQEKRISELEAAARRIARADGLDYDEVCGYETDADECDSGTCIAAYFEDHDPDVARAMYDRHARAAFGIMPEERPL